MSLFDCRSAVALGNLAMSVLLASLGAACSSTAIGTLDERDAGTTHEDDIHADSPASVDAVDAGTARTASGDAAPDAPPPIDAAVAGCLSDAECPAGSCRAGVCLPRVATVSVNGYAGTVTDIRVTTVGPNLHAEISFTAPGLGPGPSVLTLWANHAGSGCNRDLVTKPTQDVWLAPNNGNDNLWMPFPEYDCGLVVIDMPSAASPYLKAGFAGKVFAQGPGIFPGRYDLAVTLSAAP